MEHDPIPFDALSISVGSMPAGWKQQAESPLLVPIKPMQTFLRRLSDRLENASTNKDTSLRIAIVGGVASVEITFCVQGRFFKDDIHRDAVKKGDELWTEELAERHGLWYTMRPRGRPWK